MTNLEERTRELAIKFYGYPKPYEKLSPNLKRMIDDFAAVLTRVQAEARLAALEEASRHQSIQFSIDLETHPYFCCSECEWKGDVWADHIRALAQAAAPAKDT